MEGQTEVNSEAGNLNDDIELLDRLAGEYSAAVQRAGFSVAAQAVRLTAAQSIRELSSGLAYRTHVANAAMAELDEARGEITSLEMTIDNLDPDGKQRQALEEAEYRSLMSAGADPEKPGHMKAA